MALGHDGGQRSPPGRGYYGVLGLAPDASNEDIRTAYQRLIGEIVAGTTAAAQRPAIEQAFETLGDPISRLRYDAQASAPPPPRFQLPLFRLPGRRLSVSLPRRLPLSRPNMHRVDPLLAAAIGLVAIVAVLVFLIPLIRGRGNTNQPAQSVADLVSSPTATTVSRPGATAAASPSQSPIVGQGPGGPGTQGSPGLLPLPFGPGPSLLPPQSPPGALPNEPPFLTGSAIIDMLRAVAAASAVRNVPAQIAGLPGGAPSILVPQPNPAPAGVPITSVGALPSIVGASQPSPGGTIGFLPGASLAGTTPQEATPSPPAPTPLPNRISVPSGPVTAGGAPPAAAGAARAVSVATSGPNRFVAPTPAAGR
ncbi:MAG TPA: hypothetical protein VK821_17245, partial [Dehalococcoidia bacterium]|nr:hypothetical protein [Dehalococcoidia bacterium]